MLLAIITASMVSTAHAGSAPAVNIAVPNAPTAVFARPAPAPAKLLPHGPPLILPRAAPVLCAQFNVDAALDSKNHPDANGDIHSQGAKCSEGPSRPK
jgi:hypothetical protein